MRLRQWHSVFGSGVDEFLRIIIETESIDDDDAGVELINCHNYSDN